jgi:polysaccharide export outer membrane protein
MIRLGKHNIGLLALLALSLNFPPSHAQEASSNAVRPDMKAVSANPGGTATAGEKNADQPQLQRRNPRYIIARSDTLALNFPLSPEYDETVTVQPDGFIGLVGASDLHVEGMTLPEVREALRSAYAKVLHDPIITVSLSGFQNPYFIVLGEVNKPGKYELRDDIVMTEAVAIAGGYTKDAKHSQVLLFRKISNDWAEVHQLDLKHMLYSKNLAEDIHLQPGDIIFLPKNFISKFQSVVPVKALQPMLGNTGLALP